MDCARNAAYATGSAPPPSILVQAMLTPLVCPCVQDLPVSKLAAMVCQPTRAALGISGFLVCILVQACALVA